MGTIYPVTRLRRLLRAAVDMTQALEVPNSSWGVTALWGVVLEKLGYLTLFPPWPTVPALMTTGSCGKERES